jgi:hypothetical protein
MFTFNTCWEAEYDYFKILSMLMLKELSKLTPSFPLFLHPLFLPTHDLSVCIYMYMYVSVPTHTPTPTLNILYLKWLGPVFQILDFFVALSTHIQWDMLGILGIGPKSQHKIHFCFIHTLFKWPEGNFM